jgi:hypothetical protein
MNNAPIPVPPWTSLVITDQATLIKIPINTTAVVTRKIPNLLWSFDDMHAVGITVRLVFLQSFWQMTDPFATIRVQITVAMFKIMNEHLRRHWRWFEHLRMEIVLGGGTWWYAVRPFADGDVRLLEVPEFELQYCQLEGVHRLRGIVPR